MNQLYIELQRILNKGNKSWKLLLNWIRAHWILFRMYSDQENFHVQHSAFIITWFDGGEGERRKANSGTYKGFRVLYVLSFLKSHSLYETYSISHIILFFRLYMYLPMQLFTYILYKMCNPFHSFSINVDFSPPDNMTFIFLDYHFTHKSFYNTENISLIQFEW